MRPLLIAGVAALVLCSCNKSEEFANHAAADAAKPRKKLAYCFFQDNEMKGWTASRGKDGNIVVKGKAYREDSRYQALFGPPEISGAAASIAPTITQNMTGYAAENDWWDMKAVIPGSAAVNTVNVTCGAKTLATLTVKPRA